MSPSAFGLNDWDDDEILASVLAVSQQEYLDSMKKNKMHRDPPQTELMETQGIGHHLPTPVLLLSGATSPSLASSLLPPSVLSALPLFPSFSLPSG